MIPFRTGNLSVQRLFAARHGGPAPDPREERELLPYWRGLGFDAVEDYVAWQCCEPQPGAWDFAQHRANAQAAARAGLQYVIYPWAHALPPWWRAGPGCVLARCLEHDAPGALPSPWAPSTWEAVERFWHALAAELREHVQGVAVAFPADYGECAHGSGVADWIMGPSEHQHPGLWCGDAHARAAWRDDVQARHGDPARLAAAWGLPADAAGAAFEAPPFPAADAPLAARLDFARFYRGAVRAGARRLLALARALLPDAPRELKVGHCSEALELGADWHALAAEAAAAGATLRFTGAAQGELFTRRVATLCRDHGAPCATEAPREIPAWLLPERAFADLAAGARELFEFPEQLAAARGAFEAVRDALGRAPLRPEVGVLYAVADCALQPGHGAPEALAHAWPVLRRACDLDPLDERQLARGLSGLRGLLWLDGAHVPRAALVALDAWVRAGGVLIASPPAAPRPLDAPAFGPAAALAALLAPLPGGLRWSADLPPEPVAVSPGEVDGRLLLGPGWHGREDGRWAFPPDGPARPGDGRGAVPLDHWTEAGDEPPVPCRWTSGEATLLLPVPPALQAGAATGELELELCVPPAAPHEPLRLWLDEQPLEPVADRGALRLRRPLPAAAGAFVALRLRAPVHVPQRDWGSPDRRELGVLLRRAVLRPAGHDAPCAGVPALLDGQHTLLARPRPDACVAHGRGRVLRGDGTPLAALGLLNAWLSGTLPGEPPPDPPRDALQRCLVSALDGGLLVHNPHPLSAARPQLVGRLPHATRRLTTWNSLRPWSQLAPLQTRWVV